MKLLRHIRTVPTALVGLLTRDHSKLEQSLNQTRAVEQRLKRSVSTFERDFLQILVSLEELQTTGEELGKHSTTMLELSQSEKNPVNSVSSKLRPKLGFIERAAHTIESLVETLNTDRDKIEATLSFENLLDHTFSQLTYIRTLFAVEAAPLEQSAKVMFTSLVEEIHRMQKDVTTIFSDNFKALRQNGKTIETLASSLQKQARSQLSIHALCQSEMDDAIENQTELLNRNVATNSHLKKESAALSNAIGNAIVSLQSQDIIAQKIQHIFEVCEEMRVRREEAKKCRDKGERATALRFIEHAALVIINQIDSITEELLEADSSITNRVEELIHLIQSMQQSTTATEQNRKVSDTDSSNGSNLIAALDNTGKLAAKAESFLAQAFKTIEPIRGQATNVSSTIVKLSSQLHLIGLNAEIHAARIGGSTALETLSAETSAISGNTRELCKSISEQLDQLADTLHENVDQVESLHQEAKGAHQEIITQIPIESSNFELQQTLYNNSRTDAEALLERFSKLTSKQENRRKFEATMSRELAAMQALQREISLSAKQAADRLKVEVDVPEIMSGMLARYTMNSEKDIHLQTLGLEQTPPSFEFEDRSRDPQNDFNRNQEMTFATEIEPVKASTHPDEAQETLGQNVEFF